MADTYSKWSTEFEQISNILTGARLTLAQCAIGSKYRHSYSVHVLTLLLLQGSKSVKMLIYTCTCQGISSALKSQTLSNLTCSTFTGQNESTFWLVKVFSGIVQDGQNDSKKQSKMPLCAHLGQQSKKAVD